MPKSHSWIVELLVVDPWTTFHQDWPVSWHVLHPSSVSSEDYRYCSTFKRAANLLPPILLKQEVNVPQGKCSTSHKWLRIKGLQIKYALCVVLVKSNPAALSITTSFICQTWGQVAIQMHNHCFVPFVPVAVYLFSPLPAVRPGLCSP